MPETVPIVDFHMHPGPRWCPTERRLHEMDVAENFQLLVDAMDAAGIDRAVTFLLDEDWFRTNACETLFEVVKEKNWHERLVFCAMFDIFRLFETEDILAQVVRAAKLGVSGIKIHPSLQRITSKDFPLLKLLVEQAESLGLFTVVHAYRDDQHTHENMGLEVVEYLLAHTDCKQPLIIAHAGGLDFMRALSIARHHSRVSLDLSFLLELEPETSVLAFLEEGIEKLGDERFLFGSDHPSCSALAYRHRYESFFDTLDLPPQARAAIMGGNAERLFQQARKPTVCHG